MNLIEVFDLYDAASDARLICHDDKLKAFVTQALERLECAGEILNLIGVVEVNFVDDQRAVAIEKNNFLFHMRATIREACRACQR